MNVDRLSSIWFACGQPGSGKSYDLKAELARLAPDRVILIDPDGEYEAWGYLHHKLADVVKATAFPTFRTRFQPAIDRATAEAQFNFLCQLARWHAAPMPHQAPPPRVGPLVLVVDELADVTGASFRDAPEGWRWCVKHGRKYGVTVLSASHRPEEIDKTLFSLASTLRVHRIGDSVTARRLARSLGVPPIEVERLFGVASIVLDKNTGTLHRFDEKGRAIRQAAPPPDTQKKIPSRSIGR